MKVRKIKQFRVNCFTEMDVIVKEHQKKDRAYPRPIIDCPECMKKARICWGEKLKPHLRHIDETKCKPKPESWTHQEAKRYLCKFLNEGGICTFIRNCCGKEKIIELPPKLSYEEEVRFENSRLDIGGKNVDEQIICNIEIFCTHKTDNFEDRDKILWVEVDGNEVIDELDVKETPVKITLQDLSNAKCCRERLILKEIEKSKIELLRSMDLFDEEKREDIAVRLGYFQKNEMSEAKFIQKLAYDGISVRPREKWLTSFKNRATDKCWREFLAYQKCLYCGNPWRTDWYKTYCTRCYIYLKRQESYSDNSTRITSDIRKALIEKLSWINLLPDVSNIYSSCELCKKIEKNYVTWFGKNKCLCWKCFNQKLDEDGIYEIDFKVWEEENKINEIKKAKRLAEVLAAQQQEKERKERIERRQKLQGIAFEVIQLLSVCIDLDEKFISINFEDDKKGTFTLAINNLKNGKTRNPYIDLQSPLIGIVEILRIYDIKYNPKMHIETFFQHLKNFMYDDESPRQQPKQFKPPEETPERKQFLENIAKDVISKLAICLNLDEKYMFIKVSNDGTFILTIKNLNNEKTGNPYIDLQSPLIGIIEILRIKEIRHNIYMHIKTFLDEIIHYICLRNIDIYVPLK